MNNYTTNFNELMKSLDFKPNGNKLVSKQPSENTVKLFEFLKSIYGKNILSGQQYLQDEELEDGVYYRYTGKLPAVRGYDFMATGVGKGKKDTQVERAIDWATKSGGIVTMCWHWYAPNDLSDSSKGASFYYKTTGYDHTTGFDILKAVETGTAEYDFIIREIDLVSEQLKRMAELDIPVLWRPLHEASGNWFWWGKRDGDEQQASIDAYKKLWYIIFDRMENYHKLTNLIWVWNGQDKCMEVNPNTFDIVGEDVYSQLEHDHSSQIERYNSAEQYKGGKMLTLSECGYIPHPDNLVADKVKWLWWLPWWGEFVYKRDENYKPVLDENGLPVCNEKYINEAFLKDVFSNKYVLSLQDLPSWKSNNYLLPAPVRKMFKL